MIWAMSWKTIVASFLTLTDQYSLTCTDLMVEVIMEQINDTTL